MVHRATPLLLALVGCAKAPPLADPEFSDAVRSLFREFESDEAEVAQQIRALEEQVYLSMDVQASSANDRALTPQQLQKQDVEGLEYPNRSLSDALPVAVAGISTFGIDEHAAIQLLVDHTPVEPYSPEYYQRTFEEGRDCWGDRSCTELRTWNDLTKENALMTVDYSFYKDFRWVDLSVDDKGGTGEPRWGYVARSWTTESFPGRNGKSFIHQAFTIEVWIPRDGRGFQRGANTTNHDDGEWTADSRGGGLLHMLCLWTETEFIGLNVSDDLTAATTRDGIDKNFKAADDWLAAQ